MNENAAQNKLQGPIHLYYEFQVNVHQPFPALQLVFFSSIMNMFSFLLSVYSIHFLVSIQQEIVIALHL